MLDGKIGSGDGEVTIEIKTAVISERIQNLTAALTTRVRELITSLQCKCQMSEMLFHTEIFSNRELLYEQSINSIYSKHFRLHSTIFFDY